MIKQAHVSNALALRAVHSLDAYEWAPGCEVHQAQQHMLCHVLSDGTHPQSHPE